MGELHPPHARARRQGEEVPRVEPRQGRALHTAPYPPHGSPGQTLRSCFSCSCSCCSCCCCSCCCCCCSFLVLLLLLMLLLLVRRLLLLILLLLLLLLLLNSLLLQFLLLLQLLLVLLLLLLLFPLLRPSADVDAAISAHADALCLDSARLQVEVWDGSTGRKYTFPCGPGLRLGKSSGTLEADLPVANPEAAPVAAAASKADPDSREKYRVKQLQHLPCSDSKASPAPPPSVSLSIPRLLP